MRHRDQADLRYVQILNRRRLVLEPCMTPCQTVQTLLKGLLAVFPQVNGIRAAMVPTDVRQRMAELELEACKLQVRAVGWQHWRHLFLNATRGAGCVCRPQAVNLHQLSAQERLAFFTNVYHALTIHAHLELGEPGNLLRLRQYMTAGACQS